MANRKPWVVSLTVLPSGHKIVTIKKEVVPAGIFKAQFLKLIDRVSESRQPVIVTKRGRPVVEIIPVRPTKKKGSLRGSIAFHGDIVGPVQGSWDVDQ